MTKTPSDSRDIEEIAHAISDIREMELASGLPHPNRHLYNMEPFRIRATRHDAQMELINAMREITTWEKEHKQPHPKRHQWPGLPPFQK